MEIWILLQQKHLPILNQRHRAPTENRGQSYTKVGLKGSVEISYAYGCPELSPLGAPCSNTTTKKPVLADKKPIKWKKLDEHSAMPCSPFSFHQPLGGDTITLFSSSLNENLNHQKTTFKMALTSHTYSKVYEEKGRLLLQHLRMWNKSSGWFFFSEVYYCLLFRAKWGFVVVEEDKVVLAD